MQNFNKTLYEEIFSNKVGVNPPLVVKPEEVPIISEVIGEGADPKIEVLAALAFSKIPEINDSDEEVLPANYLFSGE